MKSRTIIRTIKDSRLLTPRNEEDYDRAVEYLGELVLQQEEHPDPARARIIETLTVLLEAYDAKHHPMPVVSGVDMLRFFMEQHGLSQGDLPEVAPQSVISEILHGHRRLNLNHIEALAKRFGVSQAAFLPVR